ncbi:dihydrolipoamide dehydrogenase [uncultured Phycicoccus sp.]|uniref:dihydrolipoamide dehydrogenase n=1 Tax=uncultured Phycicoccus sp. TaxID=661422 RepID=UPI00262591F1|nr:dihydrolipoamide dehydrogenase [uncultured Phycicoccus sp.]
MAHPTMSVRRALPALAGVVAVGLGGCSGAGGGPVATYDSGGAGMDAMLSGTLSITEDCVTVDGGDQVTVPAFDGGVELADGVLRFRGVDYTDGAKIELGGGETTALGGVRLPSGCPTDHVFLVAPG